MINRTLAVSAVLLLSSALCLAAGPSGNLKDDAKQSQKAARVFREIMGTPDKAIPKGILDDAQCVAVFPSVFKAGFIVGGRGGRGVASCRTPSGWSQPAFFDLGGGSFGLQIGVQETDYVLLFMNKNGLNRLLSDKFEVGGEGSVAAGPVGREVGASTDIAPNAEILSYSRSKGLFAGLELKGVVINQDKDDMRDAYGKGVTARDVLIEHAPKTVPALQDFPSTLAAFSPLKEK
jgi:lipid-binding SYLF domain-containing protein